MKCKVLGCIENRPCETNFAVYNHNAPAFQHNRGQCICYSGEFICMRPRTKEYQQQLPMGLFLMVGFSRQEEALLRVETSGGVLDALVPLQIMFSALSSEMGEECRLDLFQQTQDNLVLQVRNVQLSSGIGGHNYTRYMLQEEVNRCENPVNELVEMINKKDSRIHHHVRLSLFVMAELIDTLPNPQQFNAAPAPRLAPAGSWVWAWGMGVAVVLAGRVISGPSSGLVNLQVLVGSLEDVLSSFSHAVRRTKAALAGAPTKAS